MPIPTSRDWQDLPKPKNLFTVRNAEKINLNTGENLMYYSAGTKIVVTQKCNLPGKTYYRTETAALHDLSHAFEASAFGLPNEIAPLAPVSPEPGTTTTPPAEKQTDNGFVSLPENGGGKRHRGFFKKLFRR